ncbi:hypothetical protein LJR118_006621 [Acidovorax sp. LjRoot118]|uniref:hypothetical protein n=1 Tax=Acidovorax sp. LjRoot118 TaxID=3342256 RepID=UPI003ECD0640
MNETLLAKRFSDRLRGLLRSLNYPVRAIDMCRALALDIEVDVSRADHLLSGNSLPTWTVLAAICAKYQVEPGYFLDASETAPPNPKAQKVRGATGGEDIIWCPPDGIGGTFPQSIGSLKWMSGGLLPHDNIRRTDVVVYAESDSPLVVQDRAYVLDRDGELTTVLCVNSHGRMGVFKDYAGEEPRDLLLPLLNNNAVSSATLKREGIFSLGPIVGTMRMSHTFTWPQ